MPVHQSHIWVGQSSDAAPANYFVENREREVGVDPMNSFAMEQGELSFDYDFTEISYLDWRDAQSPRQFIDGHSYSASYLDAVVKLCGDEGIDKINVFIIANTDQFHAPKTVRTSDYFLKYLGCFDCEED
ncbi:hypothetical protein UNDKW_4186 [Undibacterium sp. KW1]|uniref:immunity 22 family protein n=1 Tax=Undibacterium sp. KW1 TaxID=2058624 RepID=UPI001331EDB9|nr:immunity 22 family protein [Undibacterium sp. KW1]BBB62459.1 hypothetical protein UNDKW_4186 [Undibacterium sp. KW1]